MPLQHLIFDLSEGDEGVATLEAMASTQPAGHAAVMAEVQQVLDWAGQQFPGQQGPLEDGMAWQHELLLQQEAGGWCTVTLTLAVAPPVLAAFQCHFGDPPD